MADEKKKRAPRKKKETASKPEMKIGPYVLTESDLKYAELNNLVGALKKGARIVREGRELLLEIRPIVGKRFKLHKYLIVRIGVTVEEVAKVLVGASDQPTVEELTEDMLPQLKKLEETLTELLNVKTRVRFDA